VLEWVFRRCDDNADGVETPIGILPQAGDLNTEGLDISEADLAELLKVDPAEWKAELPSIEEHLDSLGERLPQEMRDQLSALSQRLG
jgi:phosphoenolpyruvate carboxykinase (GTP)